MKYLSVFNSLKRELYIFLGYCTEFNVAGGGVQIHSSLPCDIKTNLRCDRIYYSSEAYKCKEFKSLTRSWV